LVSALERATFAPTTALPLGSVTVPRTEVVAWPQAELPNSRHTKNAKRKAMRAKVLILGISIPLPEQ
jgi:hypothetical protein